MALQAVFFDLDGTLLDTAADLGAALNAVLLEEGRNTIALDKIRSVASNGAPGVLKLGFNITQEDDDFERLKARFLDCYLADIAAHTTFFPGIESLLERLADNGIQWGIATNKPQLYTEALLKHFSFSWAPSCVLSPDHVRVRKPDPEILHLACAQTNCHVSQAIYIGDHVRDIECGKNAGMRTIAALWGYLGENEDPEHWRADFNAGSPQQVWSILEKLK